MGDPNRQDNNAADYGQPVKIFDFATGLITVRPSVLLAAGMSPDLRNIMYDEEYALTKMPGTVNYLSVGYSSFASNPLYSGFVYCTTAGQERLIVVEDNKVWYTNRPSVYPSTTEMTEITPTTGVTANLKWQFCNYRGRAYTTNGADYLRCWDGSTWTDYDTSYAERFKYMAVYDQCLFLACSSENPTRVVYTGRNMCNLSGGDSPYFPNKTAHYLDFPTTDGDFVTWIYEAWGCLFVFKLKSIHRVFNSPVDNTHAIKVVSPDVGTVDGRSVRYWNNNLIFASYDGLYAYGEIAVVASAEDKRIQTSPETIRVTSEIDNEWEKCVKYPDNRERVEKVWSGTDMKLSVAFTSGGTYEIKAGDVIYRSTAYATVTHVELSSGTWAAGTAAGTLYLRDQSAALTAGNLTINNNTDAATIAGNASGWTLVSCGLNLDDATTTNPSVINYKLNDSTTLDAFITETTCNAWVAAQSLGSVKDPSWYSNLFQPNSTHTYSVVDYVLTQLKSTGTLTDTQKLNVYVTSKCDTPVSPDFNNVYASGVILGSRLANWRTLAFGTGVTEIKPGDTINGVTSGATGMVQEIVITSGSWAGDDAVGFIWISNITGTWQNAENIRIATGAAMAATTSTAVAFSTGTWMKVKMTYWDRPQSWYAGSTIDEYPCFLAFKPTGDTSTEYMSIGYNNAGGSATERMYNSDDQTPASQDACCYCMRFYNDIFTTDLIVYPPKATMLSYNDTNLTQWGSIFVQTDTATIHDYIRKSDIQGIDYELSTNGEFTGTWTEIQNGHEIGGTDTSKYIRIRIRFTRSSGASYDYNDSITLRKLRLSYSTQKHVETLCGSVVYDGRYWYATREIKWTLDFTGEPS